MDQQPGQIEGTPLIAPSSTDHPLYDQIVEACRSVFDPEIPVNIYDLGLVYTIEISGDGAVQVIMTLTAPGCPVAGEMPGWVADAVSATPGVQKVDVDLTWEPPWGMDMMSDEARLELGFMQVKPVTEMEKMIAGELYRPGDPELSSARHQSQVRQRAYNATIVGDEVRAKILDDWLGPRGSDVAIRAPFYVDYGFNITLGSDVFFNYGCTVLDVCPVMIGDKTQIGPAVQILTADHPREPGPRDQGREFGRPITIGRNVWIGGGALILPGVTVGDDAVVGAGAVVTRDVAAGSTVVGNPARPLPT